MNFYHNTLSILPGAYLVNAGSTQRMQLVTTASYSGQRTLSTYMATVQVIMVNDMWLHDLSDANPRTDLQKRDPYQVYRIYTTSISSPDGALPYEHGDYFIPNGNLPGLVAGVQHPIRGIQYETGYAMLTIERKL